MSAAPLAFPKPVLEIVYQHRIASGYFFQRMTRQERAIAELVAEGRSNKEIAYLRLLKENTIKIYLTRMYDKLGVRSRFDLARAVMLAQVLADPLQWAEEHQADFTERFLRGSNGL